jgi:predicted component of type VI protein secretion system
MIRLTQTFGAHAGRTRELDQDVVRLGRLPTNDIAFDPHADLDASGNHAEIRREGAQWVVHDVGSRNGTYVNGQRVTRQPLNDGDELEFGTGGPRVRVELRASVVGRPGAATAPATPIGPIPDPVSQPPPWSSPSGPPRPVGAPPAWERTPPPVLSPQTPAPIQPMLAPIPESVVPGAPGQKLYGKRTMEMMIQSAVQSAQTANIQQAQEVVATEVKKSTRGLYAALVAVLVLFILVLCVLTGIVSVLFVRTP